LVVRPYWKGYLKLALVSCPIALHAACSTAERIRFRQVNKATGNRLRQQLIDERTGAPVGPEHKARGYEVARGEYLIVADEELEAIEIASTHTIEIDSFVPRSQIDQRFFDTAYYITPNEQVGQEALRLSGRRKPLRVDERSAERVDVDLLVAQHHHPAWLRLPLAVAAAGGAAGGSAVAAGHSCHSSVAHVAHVARGPISSVYSFIS
jgi:hypothetical protein